MKLLALAASTRPGSLNKRLLAHAVARARDGGAEVTELDYATLDAPIYHDDGRAMPPGAVTLRNLMATHDGLLLASPEYNWSVPGGLKNLIDWLSIEKPVSVLGGKTALLMSASPSARGGVSGLQQLRTPLEVLGMWVYPQLIAIGNADNGGDTSPLVHEKDARHLAACVTDFLRATNALTGHASH
jgi:NAD(P)H-dependent FMN reductase